MVAIVNAGGSSSRSEALYVVEVAAKGGDVQLVGHFGTAEEIRTVKQNSSGTVVCILIQVHRRLNSLVRHLPSFRQQTCIVS